MLFEKWKITWALLFSDVGSHKLLFPHFEAPGVSELYHTPHIRPNGSSKQYNDLQFTTGKEKKNPFASPSLLHYHPIAARITFPSQFPFPRCRWAQDSPSTPEATSSAPTGRSLHPLLPKSREEDVLCLLLPARLGCSYGKVQEIQPRCPILALQAPIPTAVPTQHAAGSGTLGCLCW